MFFIYIVFYYIKKQFQMENRKNRYFFISVWQKNQLNSVKITLFSVFISILVWLKKLQINAETSINIK